MNDLKGIISKEEIIEVIRKEIRHAFRMGIERERYTLNQAAKRLGVSPNGFWKTYVTTGKLIAHQENRHWYISDDSIKEYIHRLEIEAYRK